jgi:hypothetical protein
LRVLKIDGTGGADLLAGAAASFFFEVNTLLRVDGIFQGHRLGVGDIYSLAFDQPGIVMIHHLFGTFLRTLTTGNAFIHIHIAGLLSDSDFEIAFFTVDAIAFCKS